MLELHPDPARTSGAARSRRREGLRFLVLDELHTYRGRQGADVALLVRRVREALRRDRAPVRRHVGHAGRAGDARRAAAPRSRGVATPAVRRDGRARSTSSARRCAAATADARRRRPGVRRRRSPSGSRTAPPPDELRRVRRRPARVAGSRRRSGVDRRAADGRLRRVRAAADHAATTARPPSWPRQTGVDRRALRRGASSDALLRRLRRDRRPDTGFPVFAFRLHQFISRGDTVYASLEPEADRYLTVQRAAVRARATASGCCCRWRSAASAARSTTRVRRREADDGRALVEPREI